MELALYQRTALQAVSLASTGDKLTLEANRPIDVIRFGAIISTAITVTDVILNLRHRTAPANTTGQITLGTVTSITASRAIGSVLFADVVSVSPYTGLSSTRLNIGEQLVITCDTAGTAGAATLWIDFQPRGLHKRDVSQPNYARLFDSAPTVGV